MSIATAIGWGVALVLCAGSLWIRWQRRRGNPFTTRSGVIVNPSAIGENAAALVYVNDDGSVRELTEAEKKYVETEFSPLDGARPYVKSHYSQRTASVKLGATCPVLMCRTGCPSAPRRRRGRRNSKHREQSPSRSPS
jgi:hypothetical protein